jgi:uncharacterized protein (DUF362 family)
MLWGKMKLPVVYIDETEDRKSFVSKFLHLEKVAYILKNNSRVLVKPNMVSPESYPTTTNPEVLDSVLNILQDDFGLKEIIVADGAAFDGNGVDFLNHPLLKVCSRHEVVFIDMNQTKTVRKATKKDYSLELSGVPFKYDCIISLPVLKVHRLCRMTGALKNMYGLLARAEKLHLHQAKTACEAVAEINRIIKPAITIMDAVETLHEAQEVRHGGKPSYIGYMLAGTDPVALDSAGLKILQNAGLIHCHTVPYLDIAENYGVGKKEHSIKSLLEIKSSP